MQDSARHLWSRKIGAMEIFSTRERFSCNLSHPHVIRTSFPALSKQLFLLARHVVKVVLNFPIFFVLRTRLTRLHSAQSFYHSFVTGPVLEARTLSRARSISTPVRTPGGTAGSQQLGGPVGSMASCRRTRSAGGSKPI